MSGECGVGRLLNGRDFCNDVLDSTCVMYAESPRGEYLITMQSCSAAAGRRRERWICRTQSIRLVFHPLGFGRQ